MSKITFTDKNKELTTPVNRFRDSDANEIKASVNALYDRLPVKMWFGRITQTGTDNPVIDTTYFSEFTNISLERDAAGKYFFNADEIVAGKTLVMYNQTFEEGSSVFYVKFDKCIDDAVLVFRTASIIEDPIEIVLQDSVISSGIDIQILVFD
jgi:hypothetical protein